VEKMSEKQKPNDLFDAPNMLAAREMLNRLGADCGVHLLRGWFACVFHR
jgi:hypothetical protein